MKIVGVVRERERERESNNLEESSENLNFIYLRKINPSCRGDFNRPPYRERPKQKSFNIHHSLFTATVRSHCTGITLIALIITIILLLILAGVTLHFTIGENGILKNASIASNKYKRAEENEKNLLNEINRSVTNREE